MFFMTLLLSREAFVQLLHDETHLISLLMLVQYGLVWIEMVWYGMVWYGLKWFGIVWFGMD